MDTRKLDIQKTKDHIEIIQPENRSAIRDLGLYIHIPFCVKKCDYCDFLSAPATDELKNSYFEALFTEIERYRGHTENYRVPTIFFGGGTPSCVNGEYIEKTMNLLAEIFHIEEEKLEATIEVNPGTVSEDKLKLYRSCGINRLSFGLQSTDNLELAKLGRIHTFEQFVENFQLARKLGFHNINIDLMSALPGQTLSSWENTLKTIIALNPEHISAYSLIIEEGTKFYERYQKNAAAYKELPDEETDRLIYHRTKQILQENGYHRYEISNYARKGYESRHNSSYWTGIDYLGLGLGASSLINHIRFSNINDINQYISRCEEYKLKIKSGEITGTEISKDPIGIRQDYESLTVTQCMEEFMFLGLRMSEGVSKADFMKRFGAEIDTVYGEVLRTLTEKKLLDTEGDRIRLTEYGTDISNYVLSEFLLD